MGLIRTPTQGLQIQRARPITRGLVAAWPFFERGGSQLRDIAGGNHGTINGATWVGSERGAALDFNGNDTVDTGLQISLNGPFSVAMWISGDPASQGILFAQDVGGDLGFLYLPSTPQFTLERDSVGTTAGWAYELDGNWHFLVLSDPASGSNADASVYIDGEALSPVSGSGLANAPASNFVIGGRSGGFASWVGGISNCTVYSRAITASEVRELYHNPSVIYEPPKRYWLGATGGATQIITPDAAVITATVPDATISAATTLSPDPATVVVTVPDAVLSATISLTPDPAVVTVTAQNPTLFATVELTPAAAVINVTVPDASIVQDQILTPDPAVVTTTVPDASISVALQELTPEPAVVGVVVPDVTITNLLTILQPDSVVISVVALKMAVTRGAVCYRKVCCPDDPSYSASSGTSPNLNTGSRLTCCPADPEYSIE